MNQTNDYYLRKLNSRVDWTDFTGENDYHNLDWIKYANDFPAQGLSKNFKTTNNVLSLFIVKNDLSNLNRVLAAIASTRKYTAHIDYTLIPVKEINHRRFNIIQTTGQTPDSVVNTEYHRDFIEITGFQLARFAKIILDNDNFGRKREQPIIELIIQNIGDGKLDKNKLNPDLFETIKDSIN